MGDKIVSTYLQNPHLFILWQGEVQARVIAYHRLQEKYDDMWLDTLEVGACFNVYNCFFKDKLPILDFFANSVVTKLYCLKADDLMKLGCISLQDKIRTTKVRVTQNLVDDIDYFPFPKKYLESNVQFKTNEDFRQERKNYAEKKKIMRKQMEVFVDKFKKGKAAFPFAIDLLNNIRFNRKMIKKDT